jgi:hypothetical protein
LKVLNIHFIFGICMASNIVSYGDDLVKLWIHWHKIYLWDGPQQQNTWLSHDKINPRPDLLENTQVMRSCDHSVTSYVNNKNITRMSVTCPQAVFEIRR